MGLFDFFAELFGSSSQAQEQDDLMDQMMQQQIMQDMQQQQEFMVEQSREMDEQLRQMDEHLREDGTQMLHDSEMAGMETAEELHQVEELTHQDMADAQMEMDSMHEDMDLWGDTQDDVFADDWLSGSDDSFDSFDDGWGSSFDDFGGGGCDMF